MIILPYNIKRGMLAKSSMLSRNNTIMTFSVTLVEILKGYSQRLTSYYSEKKGYPYQMKEDPKVLAEQFNKFLTSKIEKIVAGLVLAATHPINKSYIESKLETEHKFTEFIILSGKDVE